MVENQLNIGDITVIIPFIAVAISMALFLVGVKFRKVLIYLIPIVFNALSVFFAFASDPQWHPLTVVIFAGFGLIEIILFWDAARRGDVI